MKGYRDKQDERGRRGAERERWGMKGYRDKQDERGRRDIEINKMKEGEGAEREREVGDEGI